MRRFDNKNAVVTGGSSGIGRAIAVAFAEEGAHVVAVGRDEDRLRETQSQAPSGAIETCVMDMGDPGSVTTGMQQLVEKLGVIHVLVNCAGVCMHTPVLDIPKDQWDEVLATNLSGPFYASQIAARSMVANGSGVIINISSIAAFMGETPCADYNISKAGISMLTQSMAYELGHLGVRCIAIAPGQVTTPMGDLSGDPETFRHFMSQIPLRRPSTPREQANVVLFAASDEASYMTGLTIRVDGGAGQGFWDDPRLSPPGPSCQEDVVS